MLASLEQNALGLKEVHAWQNKPEHLRPARFFFYTTSICDP